MLEPLAGTFGSALAERMLETFGEKVIKRWSHRRATVFIEEFVRAIREGCNDEGLSRRLDAIVEDRAKSEALFEAFRRVAFSTSRELGPRIIALHMAEVVAKGPVDPAVSDIVMAAAGALRDDEFEDFSRWAQSNGLEEQDFLTSSEEILVVPIDRVDFDSNSMGRRSSTGSLNLRLDVGSWAVKLEQVGLLLQDRSEEEFSYDADSERHIDEPGVIRRVYRNVELREGASHLLRLTRSAKQAGQKHGL